MLHHVYGRKFSRPDDQRASLLNNLIKDFIAHDRLVTTKERTKAIQGTIDHLVTVVKKDKVNGSRQALQILKDKRVVNRLVSIISPLFSNRPGGFTRTTPMGFRSDTAQMVRLEWVVEIPSATKTISPAVKEKPVKKEKPIEDQKAETKPRTKSKSQVKSKAKSK